MQLLRICTCKSFFCASQIQWFLCRSYTYCAGLYLWTVPTVWKKDRLMNIDNRTTSCDLNSLRSTVPSLFVLDFTVCWSSQVVVPIRHAWCSNFLRRSCCRNKRFSLLCVTPCDTHNLDFSCMGWDCNLRCHVGIDNTNNSQDLCLHTILICKIYDCESLTYTLFFLNV